MKVIGLRDVLIRTQALMKTGFCGVSQVIAISIRTNHYLKGEASWNVTWDMRLARWLRRPDSAWLLFGAFGSKYCSYY
ncbi:uncharacterized protein HKW66_Vig0155600 [Vigna angularis]|uniref:Uncharacterized protein n=1 Tax=Phaseolus angularis TaxID=3914 RepID=A0A8T0JLH0_PHAAN|nr:uncharacterized protein HKW66_Vig0155600 [Vigna angularis]